MTRIVDLTPERRDDFARLNIEWIERWFTVEQADVEVLEDPEGRIIAKGGRVLFALDEHGAAVGCVALKHDGDGVYELSKMAVAPDQRGTGVGRALMDGALDAFREMGGTRLYLETNHRLEAAIALYERSGFVHADPPSPSPYARADVYMVWNAP